MVSEQIKHPVFFQIYPPDECQERLIEPSCVEEGHPDQDAEDDGRQLDADVMGGPLGFDEGVVEDEGRGDAREEGPPELNLQKRSVNARSLIK